MIDLFWNNGRKRPRAAPLPRHIPMTPCSDLWDLVIDMDWERVIEHARDVPVDAQWQDGHWHETPLYLACQHNPPLQAVEAIVEAYPRAVLMPTRGNRDLPLHIACRYQLSAGILQVLLSGFPVTAVEQTRWGRTPIMALWEFRDPEKLEEDAFWTKIECLLRAVALFRQDPQYYHQKPKTRTKNFRGNLTVEKENNVRSSDSPVPEDHTLPYELMLVHAAVSLGSLSCPFEVLQWALEQHPQQARMRDNWGQLPLHIAVGPSSWSAATRRKYKPRERKCIALLLHHYRDGARERERETGRYPLHMAVANRHCWDGGVQDLFLAAPEVLSKLDPETRLFPFQLAAVPVGETLVDIDTIYGLLRSRPELLAFCRPPPRTMPESTTTSISKTRMHEGLPQDSCPHLLRETCIGTVTALAIGCLVGAIA